MEDYPRKHTTLAYTDGSSSYRYALSGGRHQRSISVTPYPWYYQSSTTAPWGQQATTPSPWWWWWQQQQLTTAAPTTPSWWWQHQQTTTPSPWWWWQQQQQYTTTAPTTPAQWWWWLQTTTTTTTTVPPQEYTTSITSHQRSYEPFSKLPLQFSVLGKAFSMTTNQEHNVTTLVVCLMFVVLL